uniref:Uncharacterized protein n=1 Tax=Anser brachyrhynchus TaxID=132585 RepID=A0A8B9I6W1_9AVES
PSPRLFCRVFKKASPNGKLTVYLGKRDFVDHIDVVDPVGEWGRVSPCWWPQGGGRGVPGVPACPPHPALLARPPHPAALPLQTEWCWWIPST